MRLSYFAPSASKREFLTMHAVVEDLSAPAVELLPAMLPNLHIRVAGQSAYIFGDGKRVAAPAVSLIGPTTCAYRIEMSAGTRLVAVGFLPMGWLKMIRCPANALADSVVDGVNFWGRQACADVCSRLVASFWDGHHIDIVETLLSISQDAARNSAFVLAADNWLEQSRGFSVDLLSAQLDVSRRQLQRLMQEYYGASPKAIAMKYRALNAAAHMAARGGIPIADVLAHYADQPHLTRDFQRFVGMTPGAFMRDRVTVAAATMIGRRKAGAARPLTLWS